MTQNSPKITLIDPLTLHPPRLPADLAGMRLLHVTDLHIRKRTRRTARLLAELQSPAFAGCDLLLVTGDTMHGPGHELAALTYLQKLIKTAKPRHGAFGSFGNHDSPDFIEVAARLPITWLRDDAHRLPDLPVNVLGLSCSRANRNGDLPAALLAEAHDPARESGRLRILLSHMPLWLTPAAEVGIDLVFSGHTHGGQCRLPGGKALYNSCPDWPLNLSSGVIQQSRSLQILGRGMGESNVPGLRLFCKPHIPLITLQPPDAATANAPGPDEPHLLIKW